MRKYTQKYLSWLFEYYFHFRQHTSSFLLFMAFQLFFVSKRRHEIESKLKMIRDWHYQTLSHEFQSWPSSCKVNSYINSCENVFFIVLFAIFILHSRESKFYCYTLDEKSALAWELPFSRFMVHLSSTQRWGVPLSALPKDTTSELAGLFSTTSSKCRTPSREAADAIFKSLLV